MGKVSLYCKDCNVEIFVDVNMVMLKDVIWEKISDKHEDSYCDCCIEKRLGRPITIQDFNEPTMGVVYEKINMIMCNAMWLQEQKLKCRTVYLTPEEALKNFINPKKDGKNN